MSLKDKIRFFLFKHSKKVRKTSGWGWGGLSILVFPDDDIQHITKLRINYFLIIFIVLVILILPAANIFFWIDSIFVTNEKAAPELEIRQRLLEISKSLSLEKKNYIEKLQSQVKKFHDNFSTERKSNFKEFLDNYSQITQQQILLRKKQNSNINLLALTSIKERARFPLELLMYSKNNMEDLVLRQIPFVLEPIFNRMLIYNLTPRGWGLLGGVGHVTSKYGNRQNPTGTGIEFHSGVDFAYIAGTPIIAIASGYVVRAVNDSYSGYGKFVHVHHGFGYSSLYAHCQSIKVSEGQYVEKGQVIGYVGHTGRTTGDHLHLTILYGYGRPVDPMPYVELK